MEGVDSVQTVDQCQSSAIQRFRVRYGLLGREAGKGRLLLLGRKSVSDSKTLLIEHETMKPES